MAARAKSPVTDPEHLYNRSKSVMDADVSCQATRGRATQGRRSRAPSRHPPPEVRDYFAALRTPPVDCQEVQAIPLSPKVKQELSKPISWLKLGTIAGNTASAAFSGFTLAVAGTYLATAGHSSSLVSAGIATTVVASVYVFILLTGRAGGDKIPPPFSYSEVSRIKRIVNELCTKGNMKVPELRYNTRSDNFGLLDCWGRSNKLLVNPHFSRAFSDGELREILAHELSHADRKANVLRILTRVVASGAQFCLLFTALRFMKDSGIVGGSSVVQVMAAVGMGQAFRYVERTIFNIGSRANELLTDLRGVRLSEDPESFVGAMQRLHDEARHLQVRPIIRRLFGSSHPSSETRIAWVKRWFSFEDSRER